MHVRTAFLWVFSGVSRACGLLTLAALLSCVLMAQEDLLHSLRITVHDKDQKPVAGATITLKFNANQTRTIKTNENGEATASNLPLSQFQLSISKNGYQAITQQIVPAKGESTIEVEVALVPKLQNRETMTVESSDTLEKGGSSSQDLERQDAKKAPERPATIADALPLLAGVVRGPEGLSIAGAGEQHSALLVNSVDTTDPATGLFGLTIPVDAVENLNMAETPYLAQFGGFTGGVISAATRGGGDKWNFEFNDPFPEFRIRSLHVQGLRSLSPHVSFSGPLLAKKLYFAEATEVVIDKAPVLVLPFPFNETKTNSINSFTQLDLLFNPKHTLTGTFHIAPQEVKFAGLNFFNPQPVTPNLDQTSRALALTDRLALGGGILQSTLAIEHFRFDADSQGSLPMVITPVGNTGNYFSEQARDSERMELIENYSVRPIQFKGTHTVQVGAMAARSKDTGAFTARPVFIQDVNGATLKSISFTGGQPFRRTDMELAAYAQDHWALNDSLAFDGGLRVEQQGITATRRLAPRAGFVWLPPLPSKRTSIRGGTGIFYDRVPLDVYAFQDYPRQLITIFSPDGQIIDGPTLFRNVIMASDRQYAAIHRKNRAGNFAPYSIGSSLEVEQSIAPRIKLSAKYSLRNSHGLVTVSPGVLKNGLDALIERDSGNAQYREFTLTAKVGKENGRKVFFSYTRSRARGDLNESGDYVGNLPFPIVRPNFFSNLSGDVPNRFLIWGESTLPWKMRIIPLVEYRTGFPYFVTDAYQNLVGLPNSDTTRFANYFSLDARLAKDFPITAKYTARISVRGLNLTNHFNPLAVRSNTADPLFGNFFGNYGRRFKLDFDILF
ncbi:MAG TPA: carboxypeptidase regulatory-like domain-containing protein [Candidatus Angelobacter sp.]